MNLDFVAGKRKSDAAGLGVFKSVGGDCGRTLSYTVSVENLNAQVIKSLFILGVKSGAADDNVLKISSELLMHLRKKLAADIYTEFQKETADLYALFKDILSACLFCRLPHALVYGFNNKGNT